MVKLVIKIKGLENCWHKNITNARRDEMELAQNSAAIICQQGLYVGNKMTGIWYPPHRIEEIGIEEVPEVSDEE